MRVLLADAQPKVRLALRLLLEQQRGLSVVGMASEVAGLLSQTRTVCPDLVLLDWELPGQAIAELLPILRKTCPGLYVIALNGSPDTCYEALAAGVDAFVSKTDTPEQLLAAIKLAEPSP